MNPDMLEYAPTGAAFSTWRVEERVEELAASAFGDTVVLEKHRTPVFAVRTAPAPWFASVNQAILRLADRSENWDSYGAKAIDPAAVANATRIARELAMIEGVARPVVGGTPDGEVVFEWDTGEWSLDLTVDPSDQFHYAYLDRLDPACDDEQYTRNLDDLLVLLTQLPRR